MAAILVTIAASPRIYSHEVRPGRTPVVLDADIGSDIDDAFALAMVLRSPSLDLKAVTTVSGDTQARARIAAKMLWVCRKARRFPWEPALPINARGLRRLAGLKASRAPLCGRKAPFDLLKEELDREHGRLVIVAIGPLTNIAEFAEAVSRGTRQDQGDRSDGAGSVARGYTVGSGPTAEYNIAGDGTSARKVFSSGIPILMAPLDVTAALSAPGCRSGSFLRPQYASDGCRAPRCTFSGTSPSPPCMIQWRSQCF